MKIQPRGLDIMRRTAVAGLILEQSDCCAPTRSRDSRLESWQSCWMRAVVWMQVITRRCVGLFWNVWWQQNSLVARVRQQQHAVVSLQCTNQICGRPQSMRKLRLTGPR